MSEIAPEGVDGARQAAVLVDYQNLHHYLKGRLGRDGSSADLAGHLFRALRDRLSADDTRLVRGRAYADFGGLDDHTRHVQRSLYLHGVEPVYVPGEVAYTFDANWKLLLENYNECYHCTPAHPEFSRSHAIHMSEERVTPLNDAMKARSAACNVPTAFIDRVGKHAPAPGVDFAYNRYALYDGFLTGSEDGAPVAPLLGQISGHDGGASDAYVGFLNPMLLYCDHAVLYRFLPVDAETCAQEIIWLVHADAEAGRDYDVDRLTWLWDVTTKADKRIVEDNARGVASRHYVPGPLVPMEGYVARFIDAYQTTLRHHEART